MHALSPPSPRFERRGPTLPSHNMAVDIYNALQKENLLFLGTRGSNAEAFLDQIEERGFLFSVDDKGLFKCLPLFLTGTVLY